MGNPVSLVTLAFQTRAHCAPGSPEFKLATMFLYNCLTDQDKYAMKTIIEKGHLGSMRTNDPKIIVRRLKLLGYVEELDRDEKGIRRFRQTPLGVEIYSQKDVEVPRHVEWYCGVREEELG